MYRFDDRWVLSSRPLTILEFNTEYFKSFDCLAVAADFYDDRLRCLTVTNLTNINRSPKDTFDLEKYIPADFTAIHGDMLPGVMYMGIAITAGRMSRFFRITKEISEHCPGLNYSKVIYELAGLPGEGAGPIDRLYEEAYPNE